MQKQHNISLRRCFQNITSATINSAYETKIWLTQLTDNGFLIKKNQPQVAKDPNNNNKRERNVNEFEQVPIKEKESWLPLQKLSLLPQNNNDDDDDDDHNNNNNNNKNIETNKAKEQMDIKQERKKKS